MNVKNDKNMTDVTSIVNLMGLGLEISKETNMFNSHFFLYKNCNHNFNQQKRRELFLKRQKECRQDIINKTRNLIEEEEEKEEEIRHYLLPDKKKKQVNHLKKNYKYKNQLMLSEWMLEKPHDFELNWTMVICPFGKRCLVISSHGQTKAYARNGYLIKSFPSYLPGGNKKDQNQHRGNSILDCIYSETEKIFFILDLIAWNDACFLNSSADLRFYWLTSRITEEYSKLNLIDKLNPYKFSVLNRVNCDKKSIERSLLNLCDKSKVDGILFFHKFSLYTSGLTPLVCWLKLNMLKDILEIEIDVKNTQNKMEIED